MCPTSLIFSTSSSSLPTLIWILYRCSGVTVRVVVYTPRVFDRMLDHPCWRGNAPLIVPDHLESVSEPSYTFQIRKWSSHREFLSFCRWMFDDDEARNVQLCQTHVENISGFSPMYWLYRVCVGNSEKHRINGEANNKNRGSTESPPRPIPQSWP